MISEVDGKEAIRLGIYNSENSRFYMWSDGESVVHFSGAKQGNALCIHIAAEGRNKLHLREAVSEFCDSVFEVYDWCQVILGAIKPESVVNLAKKCGFEYLADGLDDNDSILSIYAKYRRE